MLRKGAGAVLPDLDPDAITIVPASYQYAIAQGGKEAGHHQVAQYGFERTRVACHLRARGHNRQPHPSVVCQTASLQSELFQDRHEREFAFACAPEALLCPHNIEEGGKLLPQLRQAKLHFIKDAVGFGLRPPVAKSTAKEPNRLDRLPDLMSKDLQVMRSQASSPQFK